MSQIISLMHSSDGKQHACCICFHWFTVDQLEPVSAADPDEPKVWDVCKTCAARDKESGARY